MTARNLHDPTDAFAELGRVKLNETDLDGVLHKVAELAKSTIAAVDEASVTLVRGRSAHTVAHTGELALILDEWQYVNGTGPCLEAATTSASVSAPDLTDEDRWPGYTPRAVEAGVRSCLSVGMPVADNVTGALNLYATRPHAFDDDAQTLAQTLSEYASVALANAHLYDESATLAQHMHTAMANRAVIEQAKGIIMADRRCSSEEAFLILSKLSQDTNRKVRDVAATLVANAQRPS
jgi:GAF domain-containing protein